MPRYYTNLDHSKPTWECECCEEKFYATDPVVTRLTHYNDITKQEEVLYADRKFCRTCADYINQGLYERHKKLLKQHRLNNEGGQLALFS
jgi:hypothetical protein